MPGYEAVQTGGVASFVVASSFVTAACLLASGKASPLSLSSSTLSTATT